MPRNHPPKKTNSHPRPHLNSPTPPKVRSFSPGREKFEKLLEFKKRLDQERKSSPRPGPSHSTPSSPRQPRTICPPPTTPPHRSMPPPLMSVLVQRKKGPTPLSAAVGVTTNQASPTSNSCSNLIITIYHTEETAAELVYRQLGELGP